MRYIIVFDEHASEQQLSQAAKTIEKYNIKMLDSFKLHRHMFIIQTTNETFIENIAKISGVSEIEPDGKIRMSKIMESQWGLERISSTKGSKVTNTGMGVNVYVLDSGMDTKHIELAGKTIKGADFIKDGLEDCAGHGTQVGSIIAGRNIGVSRGARLISVRILDCDGQGTNSDLVRGLNWIVKNHVKPAVVNLSVGGPPSKLVDNAVNFTIANNIPVIIAAGNGNIDACLNSPSDVHNAIKVAATNQLDERALFSNYGRCVSIHAPGVAILCAKYSASDDKKMYTYASGTSMAAPFVTGVSAEILEKNPNINPEQLYEFLIKASEKGRLKSVSLKSSPNFFIRSSYNLLAQDGAFTFPYRPGLEIVSEAIEISLIAISGFIALFAMILASILLFKKRRFLFQ